MLGILAFIEGAFAAFLNERDIAVSVGDVDVDPRVEFGNDCFWGK